MESQAPWAISERQTPVEKEFLNFVAIGVGANGAFATVAIAGGLRFAEFVVSAHGGWAGAKVESQFEREVQGRLEVEGAAPARSKSASSGVPCADDLDLHRPAAE